MCIQSCTKYVASRAGNDVEVPSLLFAINNLEIVQTSEFNF